MTYTSPFARAIAAATILGGLAFATPSFAAGNAGGAPSDMEMASPSGKAAHGGNKMPSPEEMTQKVETRISNLHEKLKITPDQEAAWNDVAQAMRDSEAGVIQAVQDRHRNANTMTAVDDLDSYQKIAQAHADGLKKVVSAFQTLYSDMPDDQKKNADDVFGKFEGHRGLAKASATSKKSAHPADNSSAE